MSAIKTALQQNQKSGKRKIYKAMSADVSPDSKCPICLDRFNNISYLDICLHKFCFRCIHEWSKNKAECPLCKQPFNSIYHSIKSEQDYKKYDLQPLDNGSFGTFGGVRFRYRTTLTGLHRQMRGRTSSPPDNGVMFEGSTHAPQQLRDRYIRRMMMRLAAKRRAESEGRAVNSVREQEMVNFRRELYRRGVRVQSVADGGRSRDTSAEFFRRNPACLHRLVPWVKRELLVLYGAHGTLVNIVQHIIMSRITCYDMEDGPFQEELRPFLQGRTEHFLHEFISFAKSPFNMESYDQHAVYDCPSPSSNENSSSDSTVIAISEDEEHSMEGDPPGNSTSSLSHSVWDDETPGPSYSTTTAEQSRAECLSVLDSDSDSSLEEAMLGFGASLQQMSPLKKNLTESGVNKEECSSSDSDDCVIVGFVKPTTERTPELVKLSSDSDNTFSEDTTEVPLLPQHIRFFSLSPIVSQSSDPSVAEQSEHSETDHRHLDLSKRCRSSTYSRHKMCSKSDRANISRTFESKDRSRVKQHSKDRDHRRRSRSEERKPSNKSPAVSYSSASTQCRERSFSNPSGRNFYTKSGYKSRDSDRYMEKQSCYYSRHRYADQHSHSRSRSRSRESWRRTRRRSHSRAYSSSRSPSTRKRSHHDKPGGKRKYKTRHLEELSENDLEKAPKKKSKERHRKKSKDRSKGTSSSHSLEMVSKENSNDRSKHHHKKKKKHKKKSKKHKNSERSEKGSPNIITIDSDSESLANDSATQTSSVIQETSNNHIANDPVDRSPTQSTAQLDGSPDSQCVSVISACQQDF